jgi:hypothetical protein
MAVGDDAASAGYALVPDTGEEGLVRYGAREINRTRDFIALVKAMIPDDPDLQAHLRISLVVEIRERLHRKILLSYLHTL